MIEQAHAKINFTLNISGTREDGYHLIESVMVPLKLHDSIDIEISNSKKINDDFITCDDYDVAVVKYNLCHKAIDIARKKWGFKENFRISIHKNIFLRSGLGGGSADAAAVIRAIISLLKLKVKEKDVIEVCEQIGCDVPFMYYSKPAYVTGVGEKVQFINWDNDFKNYLVLLVKPKEGISTTECYQRYDEIKGNKNFDAKKFLDLFLKGDKEAFSIRGNSLEVAAKTFIPEIEEIEKMLIDKGFEYSFMTGGGSCIVALTKDKKLIKKTEKEIYLEGKYEVESTSFIK